MLSLGYRMDLSRMRYTHLHTKHTQQALRQRSFLFGRELYRLQREIWSMFDDQWGQAYTTQVWDRARNSVCGARGVWQVQVCTRPGVGISFAILHVVTNRVYQRVPFDIPYCICCLGIVFYFDFFFTVSFFIFLLFLTLLEFSLQLELKGFVTRCLPGNIFRKYLCFSLFVARDSIFSFSLSLVWFVCLTFIVGLVKQKSWQVLEAHLPLKLYRNLNWGRIEI